MDSKSNKFEITSSSSANQSAQNESEGMKKSLRLYLIRHGETDANANGILQGSGIDLSLSERGGLQAKLLGLRFKDERVDKIISSDMRRSREVSIFL